MTEDDSRLAMATGMMVFVAQGQKLGFTLQEMIDLVSEFHEVTDCCFNKKDATNTTT